MNAHAIRSSRGERGFAIFLALFALLLLSGIGFALLYSADTETRINNNFRSTQLATVAARSGLEEMRLRLMPGHPDGIVPPAGLPSTTAANVVYLTNARPDETVVPWDANNDFFDLELCNMNYAAFVAAGLAPTGAGVPCTAVPSGTAWYRTPAPTSIMPGTGSENALDYKWVRLTLKANNSNPWPVQPGGSNTLPVCWDGTRQQLLPAGWTSCEQDPPPPGQSYMRNVHLLTALAVTPTGSRRMAQIEVAQNPPFITNAAVASQADVRLQGSHDINAYDNCSCACTGTPGNRVCTSRPGQTCDTSRYAVYTEGTVQTVGNSGAVDAGTNPKLAENQSWDYDIPSLIDRYKNYPGVVRPSWDSECTSSMVGNPPQQQFNCGTRSNQVFGTFPTGLPALPVGSVPQITHIKGNVRLTASASGSGILIVDGDLDISGGFEWYGLVLVRGVVQFTGGGANAVNIYGAILAGQTIEATNQTQDDTIVGGSVNLRYDRCAMSQIEGPRPPQMLNITEKIY